MQARTIATVAALAFSSIAVASESVSPSGVPSPLRAAVEKIAHLQELCAGQPDHPDCAAEGWRSACDELGEAPVRAATPGRRRSGLAQRAEISTERALLLHVSEMIRSGACFEPEPSEESLEAERATDPVRKNRSWRSSCESSGSLHEVSRPRRSSSTPDCNASPASCGPVSPTSATP